MLRVTAALSITGAQVFKPSPEFITAPSLDSLESHYQTITSFFTGLLQKVYFKFFVNKIFQKTLDKQFKMW
jgi:hypothetical protein